MKSQRGFAPVIILACWATFVFTGGATTAIITTRPGYEAAAQINRDRKEKKRQAKEEAKRKAELEKLTAKMKRLETNP